MVAAAKKESMKIIPPGKKKCVWMEAGVVSYKLCDNNYDCPTCSYDHAMQMKVARTQESAPAKAAEPVAERFTDTWVEKMMKLPASRRKCRYMITGEVNRKICPNAYECGTCSFDQMMRSRILSEPLSVQVAREISGFKVADGFYYHDGHTWARPDYGGQVRVGLDDFIQKTLGRLGGIEPPAVGQELKRGETGFLIRRNGDMARVLSPMDGVVVQINPAVLNRPELINESPYEEGWLFVLEPTSLRKDLKALYFGEQAENYVAEEKERLLALGDEEIRAAADGGAVVADVSKEIPGVTWNKLAKMFLRT